MKPLPPPEVPGATPGERFNNAVRMMFSVSKESLLKEERRLEKARAKKRRAKKKPAR
jgi:hypothetical protein